MMRAINRLGIQPGFSKSDFKLVAFGGFGDGCNSYTHSMAWFNDRLYVTTMRNNFALMRARLSIGLHSWPVEGRPIHTTWTCERKFGPTTP